jgi:deoxyribose-phosphate aldolase
MNDESAKIAGLIDHTLLSPVATAAQIARLCAEALEHGFKAVCVPPFHVSAAKNGLKGSKVGIATVIGFPLGYSFRRSKLVEARKALEAGATELDVVINIAALKSGDLEYVEKELKSIARLSRNAGVKAIAECCYLTMDEKASVLRAAMNAHCAFIKTSTGHGTGGATVEDVALFRELSGGKIGIKAAGGIKTLGQLKAMVAAGATRIGTSSSVSIMKELCAPA